MGVLRFLCRRVAARSPDVVGSQWTFLAVLAAILVWIALGPLVGWSGTWLLVPATATSIFAFVLVVLLQYTQNRDTRAVQLKLDELIRGLGEARTDLVRLQELSDDELDALEDEFRRLRTEQRG